MSRGDWGGIALSERDIIGEFMEGYTDRAFHAADTLMDHLAKAGYVIVQRPPDDLPTPGFLARAEDVTGLSGTGRVAWIVEFPDGKAVVRWCVSSVRQTAVFDSIEDVMAVHGHDGRTVFEWYDHGGEWTPQP